MSCQGLYDVFCLSVYICKAGGLCMQAHELSVAKVDAVVLDARSHKAQLLKPHQMLWYRCRT